MLYFALLFCVVVSTGSFAWGYVLAGYGEIARFVYLLGGLWAAAAWLKWRWFPTPAVLIAVALAGYGVWFEFGGGWMFNGVTFALFAWNLAELSHKLKFLPARDQPDIFQRTRRHILRLSLLLFIGQSLALLTLVVRNQTSLAWVLVMLCVLGVSGLQALAWRR